MKLTIKTKKQYLIYNENNSIYIKKILCFLSHWPNNIFVYKKAYNTILVLEKRVMKQLFDLNKPLCPKTFQNTCTSQSNSNNWVSSGPTNHLLPSINDCIGECHHVKNIPFFSLFFNFPLTYLLNISWIYYINVTISYKRCFIIILPYSTQWIKTNCICETYFIQTSIHSR